MRLPRFVLLSLFALVSLASTLSAQFSVSVQEIGQVVPASIGGAIVFDAPAIGRSVVATITIVYSGSGNAVFSAPSSIIGSTNFSGSAPAITLSPAQSFSFPISYTPPDGVQQVAQFSWNYSLISTTGTTIGQTTGAGLITFTLIGNTPNLVVGQINSNNNFVNIPSGGTISFQDTAVNSGSSVNIAISNAGSGPMTINSVSTTGVGFQPQGIPFLPMTLAAGTQLNIVIQFTPSAAGAQTGGLQVSSSSGTYSALLSGKGVSSFLSYQITQGSTTSPLSPSQTITLPGTNVGSKSSVVIQFQNLAPSAAVLSSLGISGTGFSFTDTPFLPLTLQPQQTASVTITFAPLQPGQITGRLFIGNDNFSLSAVGLGAALQFSYVTAGSTVTVATGGVVSFPPIAVGQTETIQFTTANTGTAAGSEVSIGILSNSGVFQTSNLPPLPALLAAGGSSTFTISFSPQTTGQSSTSLVIDSQVFTLSGFASSPPSLPTYHFTGASGNQQPFQQPGIGLSLDAPYPITLTCLLSLTIASSSFSSDPAVQFATGARQVTFTIPANTLQAVFPNGTTLIRLQTGTVAGSILIKPDFVVGTVNGSDITPSNPTALQLTIASAAPTLLTASLSARSTTSFTVTLTGYSTTRNLDHLNVQITPASGSSISAVSTTIDVSSAARAWFQSTASQALGGEFTLDLPFTLGNGATISAGTDLTKNISNVSIIGVNDIGSSVAAVVKLP